MHKLMLKWKADKLQGNLIFFWLTAVAASFWGSYLLPITIPTIGTIYLFRILLPVVVLLYVMWAMREKENLWNDSSTLEKWCYLLIAIMLVYGVASLIWAIDFRHTFRKLFNLCYDLCFFFLILRLCRNEKVLRTTLWVGMASITVLCVLGIDEVFCGGIFSQAEDKYQRLFFLQHLGQAPVVVSNNTNDYVATLCYVFAAAICLFLKPQTQEENKRAWWYWCLVLAIPVLYFLILAASASLVMCGFFLILAGLTLYFLCGDRKRIWVLLLSLTLMGGVWFANQYQYIVPPIQQYLVELREFQQQTTGSVPPRTTAPIQKPHLIIGNPNAMSLEEEFYDINLNTGEKELRQDGTGGVRARLLLHALECFKESKGLGVGLGNTEILARDLHVTQNGVWSIHCFVARIIADYGLFVLIPMCAIAWILLKQLITMLFSGLREKNGHRVGYALCCFCLLCAYPFVSTASSDAQDCIAMWLYLATVVLLCQTKQTEREEILA